MPAWHCGFKGCNRPAVQKAGDCILCDRHLCRLHLQDKWHQCPKPDLDWVAYSTQYVATEERQMRELCARLNGPALCARASSLRDGINCTADLSPKALSTMMGGQNCHAEIFFEDGIRWIARFRLAKTSSPPPEIRDYLLKSEAATMTYLQRHTHIPCPRIYDWSCETDESNAVGLGYILMEKVTGKPVDWQVANPAQKEIIMQQLADIFLEIEKHPFEAIGSIVSQPAQDKDEVDIGGIARSTLFRDGTTPLGPFYASSEAAREVVEHYLDSILAGEVGGSHPVDVYLTHRFRLDVLPSIWKSPPAKSERFYLMHPDDKGDHIFIDEAHNITAIVDWEWAQTVPKELAFSSPCMMWPVAQFYEGFNTLSNDERRFADIFKQRGRSDLADLVLSGRRVQRYFFFLGGDPYYTDRKTFLDLFAGLRRAFDSDEEKWEDWKTEALTRYVADPRLQVLQGEAEHAHLR